MNAKTKKIKVFGVPWHVAHQHSLSGLSFIEQYDLLINPYRKWGLSSRPFPDNFRWVTEFKRNYYDLAILHVDQQSIYNPEMGDRIHKGKIYQEVKEIIGDDCPIVTINHMTPFHDKYESPYVIKYIKKMTEGTTVICNSEKAAEQWGFGTPIIHGMKKEEWWDLPKEPRAITILSPAGMEKAYRRIFLTTVRGILRDLGVPFYWVGVDKKLGSFDEYRDYIGRSLVSFMPTWQSPMPRSRTESCYSGACIVTTPYHDASKYWKHGETGFLTSKHEITDPRVMDNPEVTANLIKRLVLDEPELAIKIGQAGKQMAYKKLNFERFEKDWTRLLKSIGVL